MTEQDITIEEKLAKVIGEKVGFLPKHWAIVAVSDDDQNTLVHNGNAMLIAGLLDVLKLALQLKHGLNIPINCIQQK